MSLGGAGAEITGSFFSRGLALALDVGAEEVEVTTAATGWGLGMGRAKGTSVLSSRLRSSPDTFGTLAAFASGLSFKVGPYGATREKNKAHAQRFAFLSLLGRTHTWEKTSHVSARGSAVGALLLQDGCVFASVLPLSLTGQSTVLLACVQET